MTSANSFLSSTAYHASNARYASSQAAAAASSSSSSSATPAFNIRSNSSSAQQQLNDLNSTRSSTSSCSTSHCLSNQCLECTTILSTRPALGRCNLTSHLDSTSNGTHFVQSCSYLSNSTVDSHPQLSAPDDQASSRVLSMNIPVDNSNRDQNENPSHASTFNIDIDEEEGDVLDEADERTHLFNDHNDQNEQLQVFVGFYRPGEYQRETMEEDDDDDEDDLSDASHKSDTLKKDEQSTRELISDEDEGNEDQDFIEEDFGPNQDDENEQPPEQDNDMSSDEPFLVVHANQLDHDSHHSELHEPLPAPIVLVQIDEDEDQGFGAQFNDDCQSSDEENNHLSTISLNNNNTDENELVYVKKPVHQRSQSDSQLHVKNYTTFLSLPSLSVHSGSAFEKVEHIIIDDQQPPTTTMSSLMIKKKPDEEHDYIFSQKRKIPRTSSEELIELFNHESSSSSQIVVDDAVRDVERHVMLWNDDHARQIEPQSALQQIAHYFQSNIDVPDCPQTSQPSTRKEVLLDYLQYRSEADISAAHLYDNFLKHSESPSRIHCRFFPFWPPRDVDLLQWLSHWIKQRALPVAIINMDHCPAQKLSGHSAISSWQHRIIYGVEPRGIYFMNPVQIQSAQQLYEQLTIDSITYVARQDIVQRYNQSPVPLTPLAIVNPASTLFSDTRWRTMNVLGQVVNVLREDRQSDENETRNIPYRPTVTHVQIPSTCSSGILIFSDDNNQLINAIDLPLRQ